MKYWNWCIYVKQPNWEIAETYIRASNIYEAIELIEQRKEIWDKLGEVVWVLCPKEDEDEYA